MKNLITFPFYVRVSFILLILSIVVVALYLGHHIFIPIVLALLLAVLLRPVVHFFNKKLRFPHVLAAMISVILFVMFIAGIIFFVSWQIGDIASDWDKIQNNLTKHYHNVQQWVKQSFNISYKEQNKYLKQAAGDPLNGANILSGGALKHILKPCFGSVPDLSFSIVQDPPPYVLIKTI